MLDDLPMPEKGVEYDSSLLKWALSSVAINKRNRQLQKNTEDCINNVLKEE